MLVEGEAALASQGSAEQGETSKRPSIGCSESSESSSRYSIKRTSSTKQMLETCARQSHKLRLRVSLVCCSLGATIFATMQATALIQGNSEDWDDSNPPKDIWGKLSNLGPPLMLLALRPGDTKMIRLAGFLLSSLCFYSIIRLLTSIADWQQPFSNSRHVLVVTNDFVWGAFFFRACLREDSPILSRCACFTPKSSRRKLKLLWWAFRSVIFCFASINMCYVLIIIIYQAYDKSGEHNVTKGFSLQAARSRIVIVVTTSLFLLVLAVSLNTRNRKVIQKYLKNWDHKAEAQSAASIAQMIGGMKPAEAISFAQASLRGIRYADLTMDDFQFARHEPEWRGSEGLSSHSFATSFGKIDAFVSHTWNDDYQQRSAALEHWAHKFKMRKGRDPVIWFDKACLNWDKIEDSLKCLPVFLTSCKEFVVLLGPQYITRLWCLIELFTFLKVGANVDRMTILLLSEHGGSKANTNEARTAATDMLSTFDVRNATCYADDREMLLTVLESGFSDLSQFNEITSQALSQGLANNRPSEEAEDEFDVRQAPRTTSLSLSRFASRKITNQSFRIRVAPVMET